MKIAELITLKNYLQDVNNNSNIVNQAQKRKINEVIKEIDKNILNFISSVDISLMFEENRYMQPTYPEPLDTGHPEIDMDIINYEELTPEHLADLTLVTNSTVPNSTAPKSTRPSFKKTGSKKPKKIVD